MPRIKIPLPIPDEFQGHSSATSTSLKAFVWNAGIYAGDLRNSLLNMAGHFPTRVLRANIYRLFGMKVCKRVRIEAGCIILGGPKRIIIGQGSVINRCVVLDGRFPLTIGAFVSISFQAVILTLEHDLFAPDFRAVGDSGHDWRPGFHRSSRNYSAWNRYRRGSSRCRWGRGNKRCSPVRHCRRGACTTHWLSSQQSYLSVLSSRAVQKTCVQFRVCLARLDEASETAKRVIPLPGKLMKFSRVRPFGNKPFIFTGARLKLGRTDAADVIFLLETHLRPAE